MRVGLLVLAVLLVTGTTGCIDLGERWDDLQTDLQAEPEFASAVLLDETQAFSMDGAASAGAPSGNASDVGANWTATVSVPEGTRELQVLFSVNFSDPRDQAPTPVPLPGDQEGQVRIFVEPAGNESGVDVFYDASGSGGFDFRSPSGGAWTVGFDQGVGYDVTVHFRVEAKVPAQAATGSA